MAVANAKASSVPSVLLVLIGIGYVLEMVS